MRIFILLILFFSPLLGESFQEAIHYSATEKNVIGRITIMDKNSMISQGTWLYVKQALDHFKETKPIFIILELNTPGGQVFAAEMIADALKEMDTQHHIPIVCYINNWAISAGAMLAYSSRFIVTSKDASMGAAEPVNIGGEGGMTSASEKINSAIRSDFANMASFYDRNPILAKAMVDKDVIVVQREGQFVELSDSAKILATDKVINAKGKLLTLNAEEMKSYGVSNLLMEPMQLPPLTKEEEASEIYPADRSPLFHQPFFRDIPHAEIHTYQMDWKSIFFSFLASPAVSSLLFMGMMVAFYMEINGAGFGIAGLVGVTCLALILLSSFATQSSNWLELIIFFSGVALLLFDLFVLPTFGIAGILGVLLTIGGLFALMIPGIGKFHYDMDTGNLNAAGEYVLERLGFLSLGLLFAIAIIVFLARFVPPRFYPMQRFVLRGNEQVGTHAGISPAELPKVGAAGFAMTALRPAGSVVIENKIYDAISDGDYLAKGEKISVERLDGSTLVVRKVV